MRDTARNLKREVEYAPLHFVGCGLDNVFLTSGYDFFDTPEGRGVRIRNLDELHGVIGEYLAAHKNALNGKELRFLRKHMGLTQAELGNLVRLSSQQVARWEKDQCDISGAAESLIRILFLEHLRKKVAVRELLFGLEKDADSVQDRAMFVAKDGKWQAVEL